VSDNFTCEVKDSKNLKGNYRDQARYTIRVTGYHASGWNRRPIIFGICLLHGVRVFWDGEGFIFVHYSYNSQAYKSEPS
jgi:hypothetical protein